MQQIEEMESLYGGSMSLSISPLTQSQSTEFTGGAGSTRSSLSSYSDKYSEG